MFYGEPIFCKTVSSSIVAKFLSKEVPNGSEEAQLFGKEFEQAYSTLCWKYEELIDAVAQKENVKWEITERQAGRCQDCGELVTQEQIDDGGVLWCVVCQGDWHDGHETYLYLSSDYENICEECLGVFLLNKFSELMNNVTALKIAHKFIEQGVCGRTPKTQFRHWYDDRYIACKPDLYHFQKGYFEFKTYPISEYAIMQCKVFSWVLKEPITLIGWNDDEVEKLVINAENFELPKVPEICFTESCIQVDRICSSLWKGKK